MRILVIDDSRAMRMIIKSTLLELGHEVVEASNGQEGIDRLTKQGPFGLGLVDWNMPIMNGLEFVAKVRESRAHDAMQLVMVTTEVETSQVTKALTAGANEYVMKPFTREILREKIMILTEKAA